MAVCTRLTPPYVTIYDKFLKYIDRRPQWWSSRGFIDQPATHLFPRRHPSCATEWNYSGCEGQMTRVTRGWVDHFSMSLIGVNNLSRCRIYVMITLDGNIRIYQHFWSSATKTTRRAIVHVHIYTQSQTEQDGGLVTTKYRSGAPARTHEKQWSHSPMKEEAIP